MAQKAEIVREEVHDTETAEASPAVVVGESVERVGDALLRVQTQVARPFTSLRDAIRGDRLWRLAAILVICIACYLIFDWAWHIVEGYGDLVALFFVGWLVSFVLRPIAHGLVRLNVPVGLAVPLSYVLPIGVVTGFMILIMPGFLAQTTDLANRTNDLINQTANWVTSMEPTLNNMGLKNIDLDRITTTITQQVQNNAGDILKNIIGIAQGLASGVFQTLLVIIISVSLLSSEATRYSRRIHLPQGEDVPPDGFVWLPESYQNAARALMSAFERNFGIFLEGQLLVSVLYGGATYLLLTAAHVNYATTTAVLAAMICVVPLFGAPASLLPPLLACIFTPDIGIGPALIIAAVLYLFQTLLLNILLPRVLGRTSGVGPVVTLFVLLAGAKVAGLWGVLLGVPLAGVVKAMIDYAVRTTNAAPTPADTTTVTTTIARPTKNGSTHKSA